MDRTGTVVTPERYASGMSFQEYCDDVLHRLEQEVDIEAIRIGLAEARLPGEPDA